MSRISWTKGLFRIWIVLSVGWVVVVTSFMAGDVLRPYYAGHYILATEARDVAFERYSSEARTLERGKSEAKVRAYEIKGIPQTTVFVEASVSDQESFERVARAAPEAERLRAEAVATRRLSMVQSLVGIALLPPLAVLVIGAALAWAFRGFTAP